MQIQVCGEQVPQCALEGESLAPFSGRPCAEQQAEHDITGGRKQWHLAERRMSVIRQNDDLMPEFREIHSPIVLTDDCRIAWVSLWLKYYQQPFSKLSESFGCAE